MFLRRFASLPESLSQALCAVGVLTAISCSAVLGLDEPTHRSGGNAGSGDTGGTGTGSGGASSGTSGGEAGDMIASGSGGNQAAGSMGAGGLQGAGGAAMGGSAGTAGAAGSSAGASGAGGIKDAGIDAAPKPTCAMLPLCDDFESGTPGTPPDVAKWMIENNPNTIVVDGMRFPGQKTLGVVGIGVTGQLASLINNRNPLNIGKVWFTRMRAILPMLDPTASGAIMVIKDPVTFSQLALAVTNGYLGYYVIRNGAGFNTRMLPSSDSMLAAGYQVKQNWFCVEVKFDANTGFVQTWVDSTEITSLRADGMPTMGVDDIWSSTPPFKPATLETIGFGWWGFAGAQTKLWIDDVAVAATRIGCN
jgi:hypothetical protein